MIVVKNKSAVMKMEVAGRALASMFKEIHELLVSGTSTAVIDEWISRQLQLRGLVSRTKGYMGYKHVSCISLNDEVVHGVPSDRRVIRVGDLIKIDVCAAWKGYCADMARCFIVGGQERHQGLSKMITTAEEALFAGVRSARVAGRLGDISAAIQAVVERDGFGIVRDFAGHGIGKSMHEEPEVLNYGEPGTGPMLRAGMAFAIEPMITAGGHQVYVGEDGWTVKTVDGSWAVHVEDTVVVTDGGPVFLTRQ